MRYWRVEAAKPIGRIWVVDVTELRVRSAPSGVGDGVGSSLIQI